MKYYLSFFIDIKNQKGNYDFFFLNFEFIFYNYDFFPCKIVKNLFYFLFFENKLKMQNKLHAL